MSGACLCIMMNFFRFMRYMQIPGSAGKRKDRRETVSYTHLRNRALIRLREQNPVNYDILIKVAYFEIPPEVVAEEYGITNNNVNNRILRTRKWLRKELDQLRQR